MVKGKYYVYVTVPKRLEHLFTQKQIRRSTGTSDRRLAERKQHAIAQEIYQRFDAEKDKEASRDAFEEHRSKKKKEERYYDILQTLIDTAVEALTGGSEKKEIRPHNVRHEFRQDTPWRSQLLLLIEEVAGELRWGANPMLSKLDEKYEHLQPIAGEFFHEDVQRFVDQFREPKDQAFPDYQHASLEEILEAEKAQFQSAPDITGEEQSISSLLLPYFTSQKWDDRQIKSKTTAERQVQNFIDALGDLPVSSISKQHAYDFAAALAQNGKAQSTIRSSVSAVSAMLTWCEQNNHLDSNPFVNLSLRNYGTSKKGYKPFSKEQLLSLFGLDIPNQELLLLEILVTTGMRLDEAALLTWEQVKERDGIEYFDLTDAIVKNRGSAREVPVPSCLALPCRGTGRIFDYALDADGKASRRASRVLGHYIKKVTPDPRQVTHSLRGTLKDLLRDAGVSKETNDFITGHVGQDVASSYGSGPSLSVKYEALNSVNHPWLKSA